MKFKTLPPLDILDKNLIYDPVTGVFTWACQRHPGQGSRFRIVGGLAARKNTSNNYLRIWISPYGNIAAHRIAFAMGNRRPPVGEIDHIDRNPQNNALSNLREASRSLNAFNRNAVGVITHPHRKKNPFQARIRINGKDVHLGVFPTHSAAAAAYARAKPIALLSAARALGGEDQA